MESDEIVRRGICTKWVIRVGTFREFYQNSTNVLSSVAISSLTREYWLIDSLATYEGPDALTSKAVL